MNSKASGDAAAVPTSNAQNSVVGLTTAGTRALATQLFTFYIRVPVKLFRPTRIEYVSDFTCHTVS
jgi:hypothetical protein